MISDRGVTSTVFSPAVKQQPGLVKKNMANWQMEVLSIKPSHKTPIYEIFQTSRLTKGHIHDPQVFHCNQPRDTGSTHQRLASGRISQVEIFGIP
jgi:hypothetical protein